MSGTEGYASEAPALLKQYEALDFATVHRRILHLVPTAPSRVLDIGAGTGRDVAALAALGHSVLAVEPTAALRSQAALLHPSPAITWLDDTLPELAAVRGHFALVLLTAVWMHLDAAQRARAMPRVAGLVAPGGSLAMTLRHGPVPPGRRMFDVRAPETMDLAAASGLGLTLLLEDQAGAETRPGITWTRLAFTRPG